MADLIGCLEWRNIQQMARVWPVKNSKYADGDFSGGEAGA